MWMRVAEKGLHATAWERAPEIPARTGRNVEVYAFHLLKAQHRQEYSMALVCVTQSHALGEINDYNNSDVFRTICVLQGLLLNSCSRSCEWRKRGRIVSCQAPKPDSSRRGRRESLRAVGDFTVSPLWVSPFEASKMLKGSAIVCHAEWVLHCLGSWNTIKIHLLHKCVTAS